MPIRVYLAGPDVFLADAREIGRRKRERCARLGIEGLFPLDVEAEPSAATGPASIFQVCCDHMDRADAGLFNLSPFRGASADAGTVFELGYLFRRGKPLFGYAGTDACYRDRVSREFGPLSEGPRGPRDASGLDVEDFGLFDNLMVVRAIEASGGALCLLPGTQGAAPLAALDAFDACLELAARTLRL